MKTPSISRWWRSVRSFVQTATYRAFDPIPTRGGARNSCFSIKLSQFSLAVPARGGQSAEIRVYQSP